jgi:CHASE2 domain-containing sensor protein
MKPINCHHTQQTEVAAAGWILLIVALIMVVCVAIFAIATTPGIVPPMKTFFCIGVCILAFAGIAWVHEFRL